MCNMLVGVLYKVYISKVYILTCSYYGAKQFLYWVQYYGIKWKAQTTPLYQYITLMAYTVWPFIPTLLVSNSVKYLSISIYML